jgi:hypothetical protein
MRSGLPAPGFPLTQPSAPLLLHRAMQNINAHRCQEEVAMSLTFSEVFAIQSAIDAYEMKFPDRPSPSPEEALAWRQAGGRRRKLLSSLVLHDAMQDIRLFGRGAGAVAVKMQLRVVRSAKTGLLDFYYRIFTGASPLSGPTRVAFLWSPPPANIKVTLADVRSEGALTTAPDDFVYGPASNSYCFTFSNGVPANTNTGFFFVSTNARAFAARGGEVGDAYLSGTTTLLKVPGPTS